jgi:hypothetical protein
MRIDTGIMHVSVLQRRRRDIFVENRSEETASPVGATSGICRSYGAWYRLGHGFYKDVTPTAFGICRVTVTGGAVIQKIINKLTAVKFNQ